MGSIKKSYAWSDPGRVLEEDFLKASGCNNPLPEIAGAQPGENMMQRICEKSGVIVVMPVRPRGQRAGKLHQCFNTLLFVFRRDPPDFRGTELAGICIRVCTGTLTFVQEYNKWHLCGVQGIGKVAGELVHGCCGIDQQDSPIHPCCYDLPGELEPFLPRGSIKMDMAPVILDAPEIECHGRGSPGTVSFNMFGTGIQRFDKRGFPGSECTKNNNFQFCFICHWISLGGVRVYRFGQDPGKQRQKNV
jgi:hypothetical protein